MPTLTIDGKQVTAPDGTTLIQAAQRLGIFIPRYCYHPGLSIAGNCRICLVEVEKAPKLQIACNTPAAEGMVVRTDTQKVSEGRQAVLEFLLANHPLDCPVCDQSGECDLQNLYMQYGRYDPRFAEQKVKKPKAVPVGPTIMLDAERCILCSRCVRFTDEITHTHEFGIFNRGDRAVIGLYPGKALDNKYSGNAADICPVGALTDRDFRFKARVWYLSAAPSICNGCARGCSIDVHFCLDRPHLADGARVMRIKPRYNPEVNRWWICDEGRYGYKFIDQGRLRAVTRRGAPSSRGTQCPIPAEGPDTARQDSGAPCSWEQALPELAGYLARFKAAERGKGLGVIASAQMTSEELALVRKIFKESLGAQCTAQVPYAPGYEDGFLIKADKNPDTAGAERAGLLKSAPGTGRCLAPSSAPAAGLIEQALAGKLEALWVFGHDLDALFGSGTAARLAESTELFVFCGPNENASSRAAHWVLPSAVHVEKDGTFVNCDGKEQRFSKCFEPLKDSRPESKILLDLEKTLATADRPEPFGQLRAGFFEGRAGSR